MTIKHRGLGCLPENRRREIASLGGKAAHVKGTAHKFDSAQAKSAGEKGGRAVSADREHMAQIGSLGGKAKRPTTPKPASKFTASSALIQRREPLLRHLGRTTERFSL